jgi:hypothetical protein
VSGPPDGDHAPVEPAAVEPAPVEPAAVEPAPVEPKTEPGGVPGPGTVEEVPPLPTARELISVGLELALRSSRSIRNASMAIGLQLLAAAGPFVLFLIVVATRAPAVLDGLFVGQEPAPGSREEAVALAFVFGILVAVLAFSALAAESRIVAVSILGGEAGRRPLAPHEALRRSRQVFWRVIAATLVVQVPLAVVSSLVQGIASPVLGGSEEALVLVGLVVTTLLTVPFAYVLTGVVLGGASPWEAIRRSIGLARVRLRLALVAAIAEALAQTLLILGLGAGLEIVTTVATGLGLGLDSGPVATFATLALALLGTAAVGSLVFTVSAVAAAPQVVAFVGLTRYTAALDGARDGPSAKSARWVSIPMAIGIVIALLASLAGVSAVMRPG